jgi:hypothetical protein
MALNVKGQLKEAQLENLASDPANLPHGRAWYDTALNKIKISISGAAKFLVTEDGSQTLTNKTLTSPSIGDSVLMVDQGADASTPAAGNKSFYAKAGGLFYRNSSGNVFQIADSSVSLTTGDIKLSLKIVADSGWVLMNDTSIGSAASGATGRANADTSALYTLLWTNIADAWAPVSSGRGASAAADFAANKTLTLPRTLGRALGVSGLGSGLTSRALGEYLGTQTHALTEAELAVHTHIQNAHNHGVQFAYSNDGGGNQFRSGGAATGTGYSDNATATNQNAGSGAAHNNMQPTMFLNVMVKL